MPELPEVETIRRQLAPVVEGRRIEEMEVARPALVRARAALGGRRRVPAGASSGSSRRGKYLVWELSRTRSTWSCTCA